MFEPFIAQRTYDTATPCLSLTHSHMSGLVALSDVRSIFRLILITSTRSRGRFHKLPLASLAAMEPLCETLYSAKVKRRGQRQWRPKANLPDIFPSGVFTFFHPRVKTHVFSHFTPQEGADVHESLPARKLIPTA